MKTYDEVEDDKIVNKKVCRRSRKTPREEKTDREKQLGKHASLETILKGATSSKKGDLESKLYSISK